MKKLIITDLHGRHPRGIIEQKQRFENIDTGICLGDMESPEITEYLLKLGEERMTVIPGNHDFPYMVDCCKLLKGTKVNRNEKVDYLPTNPHSYWSDVDKWAKSKVLSEYATKIIDDFENENRFQKEFNTKAGKVVCVHASILDELNIEETPVQLWARMFEISSGYNNSVISQTFEAMKDPYNDIWMMLRGHDWGQKVYSLDRESATFANFEPHCDHTAGKYNLELLTNKCYIISCGSYNQGQYTIIDYEKMKLEFHNPGRILINKP